MVAQSEMLARFDNITTRLTQSGADAITMQSVISDITGSVHLSPLKVREADPSPNTPLNWQHIPSNTLY